jgi:hypothetical protein
LTLQRQTGEPVTSIGWDIGFQPPFWRAITQLAPLGADEVHESVKSSSCEKLAVCKVIEGAVKLSPGRGQRVALLKVVGQFWIEQDQTRSEDSPVGLGKEHRYSTTQRRELVAMAEGF